MYAVSDDLLPFLSQLKVASLSPLFINNPQRFNEVLYVITWPIGKLAPFSWADDPRVRLALASMSDFGRRKKKNKAIIYDPSKMHNQKVKHILTEIYATYVESIIIRLRQHVFQAPLPRLGMQYDLWTCKISGGKFLGKSFSCHPLPPLSIHFVIMS